MIILIGLGGSFGALLRYFITLQIAQKNASSFPMPTFIINSSGSILLGVLGALYTSDIITDWIWYLMGIGFMGGYTTFSTFSVEALQLLLKGKGILACSYVFLSVLLGIATAALGFMTTTFFI